MRVVACLAFVILTCSAVLVFLPGPTAYADEPDTTPTGRQDRVNELIFRLLTIYNQEQERQEPIRAAARAIDSLRETLIIVASASHQGNGLPESQLTTSAVEDVARKITEARSTVKGHSPIDPYEVEIESRISALRSRVAELPQARSAAERERIALKLLQDLGPSPDNQPVEKAVSLTPFMRARAREPEPLTPSERERWKAYFERARRPKAQADK